MLEKSDGLSQRDWSKAGFRKGGWHPKTTMDHKRVIKVTDPQMQLGDKEQMLRSRYVCVLRRVSVYRKETRFVGTDNHCVCTCMIESWAGRIMLLGTYNGEPAGVP